MEFSGHRIMGKIQIGSLPSRKGPLQKGISQHRIDVILPHQLQQIRFFFQMAISLFLQGSVHLKPAGHGNLRIRLLFPNPFPDFIGENLLLHDQYMGTQLRKNPFREFPSTLRLYRIAGFVRNAVFSF